VVVYPNCNGHLSLCIEPLSYSSGGKELSPLNPGPDSEGVILRGPLPFTGEARGRLSPVPGSAIAADDHRPTCSTDSSTTLFPSEVTWEETLGPLTLWRGLNSIAKPMWEIDLATDRKSENPYQKFDGTLTVPDTGLRQFSAAHVRLNLFEKHVLLTVKIIFRVLNLPYATIRLTIALEPRGRGWAPVGSSFYWIPPT